MRVAGEAAIRWRCRCHLVPDRYAGMFMRTLLMCSGIWLASTIALVWYWTGYYFGAIAHSFFRALVAIVGARQSHSPVLPDAALPRGTRYPNREHLRLLSQKIYYHSFPDWFWHYAPWGLIPTALLAGGTAFVFGPRTNKKAITSAGSQSSHRDG